MDTRQDPTAAAEGLGAGVTLDELRRRAEAAQADYQSALKADTAKIKRRIRREAKEIGLSVTFSPYKKRGRRKAS